CDGGRVQCIVMVRDDFWMAATQFMRALEVQLIDGTNSAAVDLFPARHARQVLRACGRAFGDLPELTEQMSREQKAFVKQAVDELSEQGKVVCVRLALFADMLKDKPWTPGTLNRLGGTAGVGVTFLEETFSVSTSPPLHRLHQAAARAVLNELLPDAGADIRGQMKSRHELLQASGYVDRADAFNELMLLLDSELRLVTPVEKENSDTPFYQLTHDYLVPSLRQWLTRKQNESRRGRAELRLADRSALWNAQSENKQLPSLPEWINIRFLTRSSTWTEPQRKMMHKAGRVHGLRGVISALLVVMLVFAGLTIRNSFSQRQRQAEATRLVEGLLQANTSSVSSIIENLGDYRRWANDDLAAAFDDSPFDSNAKLHAALAMLPQDESVLDFLGKRLLTVESDQFAYVRDALDDYRRRLIEGYWDVCRNSEQDAGVRFQAACALASYDPQNEFWSRRDFADFVAGHLASALPSELGPWRDALRPVSSSLAESLKAIRLDNTASEQTRSFATDALVNYFEDDVDQLFGLLVDSSQNQFPIVLAALAKHEDRAIDLGETEISKSLMEQVDDDAKESLAKRQANAAVMLLRMNAADSVWPLLTHSPDPRVRTYIIHWLSPLGGNPHQIIDQFERETDDTVKRALLLCLGEFDESSWPENVQSGLIQELLTIYRDHADSGLHAATRWLLRKWGQIDQIAAIDDELRQTDEQLVKSGDATQQWYVNGQGQTLAVLDASVFDMGYPPGALDNTPSFGRHRRRIGRRFAIGMTEVTKSQFLCHRADFSHNMMEFYPESDCPIGGVTWHEAAWYCNWLSEQEGIPQEQWCFETEYFPEEKRINVKIKPNAMELTGYRLPTEAEWEFACRAGTSTSRYFGQESLLVPEYAWVLSNSDGRTQSVGQLKPNDFGLFDMYGNLWEWCLEAYDQDGYPSDRDGPVEDPPNLNISPIQNIRGSSYTLAVGFTQKSEHRAGMPTRRYSNTGFRVARTIEVLDPRPRRDF
ncbi:MAG: formylglycine-generating enzyme family protein, partial [Pirellulaceae bacterium]